LGDMQALKDGFLSWKINEQLMTWDPNRLTT